MELGMPFLLLGLSCRNWVGLIQLIVAEVKPHVQASHSDIVDLECRLIFLLLCFCLLLASSLEAFCILVLLSIAISIYHTILICSALIGSRALSCPLDWPSQSSSGTCGVASLELLPFCSWDCRPSMHFCPYEGLFCFLPVEYLVYPTFLFFSFVW